MGNVKYTFSELVGIARVQGLTDVFHRATGIPGSIIGLDGSILTDSGWQDICTYFHRVNPETRHRCIESDTSIANQLRAGQKYAVHKCKNGLIDAAAPITVEGEHVASVFAGQFLFKAPDLEFFKRQGKEFGFDERGYMGAVAKIPVVEEAKLPVFLEYLSMFAEMLGEIGLRQAKQIEAEDALKRGYSDLELRIRERALELEKAYGTVEAEIIERRETEAALRETNRLLKLHTARISRQEYLNGVVVLLQEWAACEALGVRVLDKAGNIPYESWIGFTEVVQGRVAKGSREERQLGRVLEAGLRGRDLVRQMLTFASKGPLEKRSLWLGHVIQETMNLLRASIPSTIGIKVDVKSESGPVLGDAAQIGQVLMNLCSNAAHAMREKGGVLRVELSDFSVSPTQEEQFAMKPGPYMRLSVRDAGEGMPQEIRDRVFDPFFTTKNLGEASGLGLSVVHGIVKQHGGYVTVESEPGKGSIFTVFIPTVVDRALGVALPTEMHLSGAERVLFIDDEEALVELAHDLLEELGYRVTVTTSSVEALAAFKADPARFDLVITDQTMPDMTGIELAKEILALNPEIPIIMCTGFSDLVDAGIAQAAGIKAFAMKPLTKGEIANSIREVLDG